MYFYYIKPSGTYFRRRQHKQNFLKKKKSLLGFKFKCEQNRDFYVISLISPFLIN